MSDEAPSRVVDVRLLIANVVGVPTDPNTLVRITGADNAQKAIASTIEAIRAVVAASKDARVLALTSGAASVLDQLGKIEMRKAALAGSAVNALTAGLAASDLSRLCSAAAMFQEAIFPKSQMELLVEKLAGMDSYMKQRLVAHPLVAVDTQSMLQRVAGEISAMSRPYDDWLANSAPAITYIPPRRKSPNWDYEEDKAEEGAGNEAEAGDFGELTPYPQLESEYLFLPRRRGRPKGSFLRTPERVLMVYADLYASGDYVTQEALAKALSVTVRTLQNWLSETGMGLGWPPSRRS